MIPKRITIKSDGNELEYVDTQTKTINGVKLTEPIHKYQYINSLTKNGDILPLTQSNLDSLLKEQSE